MSISENKPLLLMAIPIFLVLGYLLFKVGTLEGKTNENVALGTVVSNLEGKQVIEVTAKGGYSPVLIKAEANKDTILRVLTNNTFDCSSALTIPSLGIRKNLPPTAATDIPLGPQKPGTKLAGTCSMGMYQFSIDFQ